MKKILSLVLCAVAVGCSSTRQYPVRLESEPPGARVYLSMGATKGRTAQNRSYLGQTPCTVQITGTKRGHFKLPEVAWVSDYVAGNAIFTAEPPTGTTNTGPRSFNYRGNTEYVEGDKIPQAIFFDFTKP